MLYNQKLGTARSVQPGLQLGYSYLASIAQWQAVGTSPNLVDAIISICKLELRALASMGLSFRI